MPLNVTSNDVGNLFNPALKEYLNEDFIKTLESHVLWLKEQPGVSIVPVNKQQAIKYQGDFFGLLTKLALDPKLWYATLRCTGLTSPTDVSKDLDKVIIPDLKDVTSLMQRHKRNS